MKKVLLFILTAILLLSMSAYGSGAKKSPWPDNEYTQLVPKPTVGTIDPLNIGASGDSSRCIIDMSWTAEEAKAYAAEVKAAGFDAEEKVKEEADYYEYFAKYGNKRYYISVQYNKIPAGEYGNITIANYNFHR